MKKELLRINRLNYNYTRTRKLENVSFCILEGECIGFLGLSYSGKDLMTSLLRGELTEGDGSGAIYLGGQKVNDWEVLGKEIYYMCPDNYATFGGLASYSYAHLLAPTKVQRDIAFTFFKRAIDMTVDMGAKIMGTPVGGMDYHDARDPQRREELYQDMLEYLRKLAEYGKTKGLEEIHIEATPLITEFPHSPEVSVQMMKDLEGTDIPIKLLVDWGHALYKPLLKEEADIELWFKQCAPYIGSIHLQQTDGHWDRHWDFTHEGGIITPELIKKATTEAGLDDITQDLLMQLHVEMFVHLRTLN